MLTTRQVRAIIRKHNPSTHPVWDPIYTNKTKSNPGNVRTVKCYYHSNTALLKALQQAAGAQNVKLTTGAQHYYALGPGITVKCVLA
jgi:hypothetical protein